MEGVLEGFLTIGSVIGLGALLAHLGVLDDQARVVLSRLSFFVASPALMVTVPLQGVSPEHVTATVAIAPVDTRLTVPNFTLNGSALAVPRVWAALVETHRQPDGSVAVPDALRPYMRGLERIG